MKYAVTLSLTFCGGPLSDQGGFGNQDNFSDQDDAPEEVVAANCGSLACVCRSPLPPAAAVEAHVRQIPPAEFVKYIANSVSDSAAPWAGAARWVDGRFAVEFEVESALSAADIAGELRLYDLEDGEYEAAADNGWTIQCDGRELGTTDFRQLPILVAAVL